MYEILIPYTPLHDCQLCGVRSTPKKVQIRNDVYGWNCEGPLDYSNSKSMLCMGCWNKVRPIVQRERKSQELRTFINRLQRNLKNEWKQNHPDHGRAA